MNFEHDYITTSELSPQETVLCMRCGTTIADHRYEEQPRIGHPKDTVLVRAARKLGNYRQVPVEVDENGRRSLMHVLVCSGCQSFEFTPEIGERIVQQIRRAQVTQLDWSGYPIEALEATVKKYAAMKILRRLQGEELVKLYAKESHHASND